MDILKNRKNLVLSVLSLLTACTLLSLIFISFLTSGEENSTSEINLTAAPTIQTTNKSNGQAAETYLVTKVVDGDTFNLLLNDKTETVRLIGIDTPETKAPNKPVECFGQEATVKL